jgi:serine/threonine-protein kinase
LLRSAEAVARFEREAVAAARIDHPNVVVATDFGRLPNGRHYLVLELVEGRDLRHELDECGPLPVRRALNIARQIASALAAAHQVDIVHRDLKPENIMLVQRGADVDLVKVLDFGIAKITLEETGQQQLTQLGAVFGTPEYMSPEQALGKAVDGRSDLYSLGVILHEMLSGKLVFEAADALGFIMQHLNATPAPLPARVPEPLRQLVLSLLEKAPDQRPASAVEVQKRLEQLLAQTGSDSTLLPRLALTTVVTQAKTLGRKLVALAQQRQSVGKVTLPMATWVLVPVGVLVASTLVLRQGTTDDAPSLSSVPHFAPVQAPSSSLPTLTQAEAAKEVERIEQLKVYQRSEIDWMILARGTARLSRHEPCALAYQAVLSLRQDLRKDKGLLFDLLNSAQDPKAFRLVLNLAESVLGRHGVDLIWQMWNQERLDPNRKEQTEKLAKKLVILSHGASPALKVAIDLTFATSCPKLHAILARAANDADSRSLERLSALAVTKGCGPEQNDDCYPCLRDGQLLAQATEKAKKTTAPELGDTAEE